MMAVRGLKRSTTISLLALAMVAALLALSPAPAGAAADDPSLASVSAGGQWTVPGAEPFFFGNGSDIPFLGDFDGDGIRTPGLYRPSTGEAFIRNSLDTGFADASWYMGNPGDVPLVGDWDGDGVDSFGIYRNGRVFLRNALTTGAADVSYWFGSDGDVPFAGDFDGDGITTVGVRRPSTGEIFITNSQATVAADLQFYFGDPNDLIVAGDWDGDGDDTVGVIRPATGTFYYRNSNDQGVADGSMDFDGSQIPVVPAQAPFAATYTLTFTASWSAATHPVSFPGNPHFSGLVGGTHNESVSFWDTGELASAGIESMAETGSKTALISEVNAAIGAGTAGSVISAGSISTSPGSVAASITVNRDYPLATVVSMLAPSPDWFVGVSGLNLFEDGSWVEETTVTLWPYDSGTDSGASYTSANQDTNPAVPIAQITDLPVGNGTPIGQFTFTRTS